MSKKFVCAFLMAIVLIAAGAGIAPAQTLTPQQQLGKDIFFEKNLSINANQSCAVCHTPEAGWTGLDDQRPWRGV